MERLNERGEKFDSPDDGFPLQLIPFPLLTLSLSHIPPRLPTNPVTVAEPSINKFIYQAIYQGGFHLREVGLVSGEGTFIGIGHLKGVLEQIPVG